MTINKFYDQDELESLPPAIGAAAKNQITQENATGAPELASLNLNEDVAFGSERADAIARAADGLPTVKIGKTEAARFALVPDQPLKHGKFHYRENLGSYRCVSSSETKQLCCKADGEPKDRFAALAFRYINADPATGRMSKDKKPEVAIQALRLSRSNFRDINNLGISDEQEVSNPAAFDIIMVHDQSRAFGYQFKSAQVLRWKDIAPAALELAKPYRDGIALSRRLGKVLSLTELADALRGDVDPDDSAPRVSEDDLD